MTIIRLFLPLVCLLTARSLLMAAPATATADHSPIHVESVQNPADIIFMYRADRPIEIAYSLKDVSDKPMALTAIFTLVDRHEQTHLTQTQNVNALPDEVSQITFTADPKGLLLGQYSARLQIKSGEAEILRNNTFIGLISPTNLPKAKPGEFMFGLDTSLTPAYKDPRLLRFTQLMGTDIVRGGTEVWANYIHKWSDELKAAAPIYEKYHLKLAYDIWPPDNRVKDVPNYMELATQHLEWAARQYKDLIPFFELGNEPDIGFFDGPIAMYADEYLKFREAIKRGNPDAIVVNGGWAYNLDRVEQFYNLVQPTEVDMIAYHGHGDVTAEESAYRRIKAIATRHGFGDKQLVETESGIMALAPPQEDIQARVCVEKFAFAIAMHEPFFHWFRLALEYDGDYSSSWQHTQPRPSVLSYRATVETLRGYKFKQILQLPDTDSEAYEFEQINGTGRACLMWVNGHDQHQAYLHVADQVGDARDVMTSDIYGNHQPFKLLDGGIASLSISQVPIWLVWSASKPFDVAVEPSLIQAPALAEFQVNATNQMSVKVRNPLDRAVSATLDAQAETDAHVTLTPMTTSLKLGPHETKSVELTAQVGPIRALVTWPQEWTVFCRTNLNVDPSKLTAIPQTLDGPRGPVAPTREALRDNKIDLAQLCNYHDAEPKFPVIVMANVDAVEDRTITIGAGADFWMQWFCNGQPVFDDLAAGNGPGYTFLDHTFEVHLKKGRNLLVCRVLSGGHGVTLAIGSPGEVEKASGVANPRALRLKFSYDSSNTVIQNLGIDMQKPVDEMGPLTFDSTLDDWSHAPANIVLSDRNLVNLHFKNPDNSLWWKGYRDLTASAWLRADQENLYLAVKVTDDFHRPAPDPSQLKDFDSISLAFSPRGKDDITAYRIGLVNDKPVIIPVIMRVQGGGLVPIDGNNIRAQITRENTTTFYKVALSRAITTNSLYLNFLVNDNDTGVRKQYLEWRPGMETLENPTNWYRVRFADSN